jgi:thiosulfate reductase cytochrome b subunit
MPALLCSAADSKGGGMVHSPAQTNTTWQVFILRLRRAIGLEPSPGKSVYLFYRHTLPVRLFHWMNAVVLAIMLMSGLQIFNAHPALYWGTSSDFANPVLSLGAVEQDGALRGLTSIGPWHIETTGLFGVSSVDGAPSVRGFPSWATIPSYQSLATGRQWHLFFAWLFVINGVSFALYAYRSGHFQRDLLPTKSDLKHLPREIGDHAKLKFPKGEAAKHYNALQKLTYFGIIFVVGPLIVLTGLTMAPTMDAAFPALLWIFGGRQTAHTIHFLCAFSFFSFFIIHIVMVIVSGLGNNLRSIVTGRYAIEKDTNNG